MYLRADLPALELHIKTRGRAEEANMDFSFLEGIVVRFVPLVIDHNLGNRMLGQARPNSITRL